MIKPIFRVYLKSCKKLFVCLNRKRTYFYAFIVSYFYYSVMYFVRITLKCIFTGQFAILSRIVVLK